MRKLPKSQSIQFSCSVMSDMDCSRPGFPVHHQVPKLAQTHVYQVGDAIQPSKSLSSPLPLAFILARIRDLSKELVLPIRWPKYWSFSFSNSPSNEYSGLSPSSPNLVPNPSLLFQKAFPDGLNFTDLFSRDVCTLPRKTLQVGLSVCEPLSRQAPILPLTLPALHQAGSKMPTCHGS